MQFNINAFGKPKYEDRVTSFFNENQCERKRYSFLYQLLLLFAFMVSNILSCKETSTKRVYDSLCLGEGVRLIGHDGEAVLGAVQQEVE